MTTDVILANLGILNTCYWDADSDPGNPGYVYRVECPSLGLIECQPAESLDDGMARIREYGEAWVAILQEAAHEHREEGDEGGMI